MNYEIMIPPAHLAQPFEEFNQDQVEEYFQWHMSQIGHRISVLNQYIGDEGVKIELDYSSESLIPLWKWYEKHIVVERVPLREYIGELRSSPKWMKRYVPRTKISLMKTFGFGADIAIYFAETVRKNSEEKISWGYFTRPKVEGYNRPVLKGFKGKMTMNPDRIIYICTLESAEKRRETRLLETYNVWKEYIV